MATEAESEVRPAVDKPWLFQPGSAGNPGGRPKSFANYIREKSLDGEKLVDKVWSILMHPKGKGLAAQKLQLDCIQWLADRGWGKAVQNVEHSGAIGGNWDAFAGMSTEDLQALVDAARALREARAKVIEHEPKQLETGEDVDSKQQ